MGLFEKKKPEKKAMKPASSSGPPFSPFFKMAALSGKNEPGDEVATNESAYVQHSGQTTTHDW